MIAKKVTNIPNIYGVEDVSEWDEAIVYKLAYNQINMFDQRSPLSKHEKNRLYSYALLYFAIKNQLDHFSQK